MVVVSEPYLYIFELKYKLTAEEALFQIEKKDYIGAYNLSDYTVFKVGINFNEDTRTIEDWVI